LKRTTTLSRTKLLASSQSPSAAIANINHVVADLVWDIEQFAIEKDMDIDWTSTSIQSEEEYIDDMRLTDKVVNRVRYSYITLSVLGIEEEEDEG